MTGYSFDYATELATAKQEAFEFLLDRYPDAREALCQWAAEQLREADPVHSRAQRDPVRTRKASSFWIQHRKTVLNALLSEFADGR